MANHRMNEDRAHPREGEVQRGEERRRKATRRGTLGVGRAHTTRSNAINKRLVNEMNEAVFSWVFPFGVSSGGGEDFHASHSPFFYTTLTDCLVLFSAGSCHHRAYGTRRKINDLPARERSFCGLC